MEGAGVILPVTWVFLLSVVYFQTTWKKKRSYIQEGRFWLSKNGKQPFRDALLELCNKAINAETE